MLPVRVTRLEHRPYPMGARLRANTEETSPCKHGLYEQVKVEQPPSPESLEQAHSWLKRLMQVYIAPSAPRQINIPSAVQDALLRKSCDSIPPDSSELDEVCRRVCELMNESLLVPFLQSVGEAPIEDCGRAADRRPPATAAVMSDNTHYSLAFSSLRRRRAPHRKQQRRAALGVGSINPPDGRPRVSLRISHASLSSPRRCLQQGCNERGRRS